MPLNRPFSDLAVAADGYSLPGNKQTSNLQGPTSQRPNLAKTEFGVSSSVKDETLK